MSAHTAPTPHRTVKLEGEFVLAAQAEAERMSRSLGRQIEHWARIGRAVEQTSAASTPAIRALLDHTLPLDSLDAITQEAGLDALNAALRDPSPEVHAAYARLGERARALRAAGALKPAPDA